MIGVINSGMQFATVSVSPAPPALPVSSTNLTTLFPNLFAGKMVYLKILAGVIIHNLKLDKEIIVYLVNSGNLYGNGGPGGTGGTVNCSSNAGNGQAGVAGGDGIGLTTTKNLLIENLGNIYGGGGGGGGGGSARETTTLGFGGGGGGSGQGSYTFGGTGGGLNNCSDGNSNTGGHGSPFSLALQDSGPANGGNGGSYFFENAATGGAGGSWASAGLVGGTSIDGNLNNGIGGAGGAAGKAINLNGGSVTWISGNNTSQVKGVVS